MDRRGFLQPKRLLHAAGQLQGKLEESIENLDRLTNEPLVTMRREAMACLFAFQFGITEPDRQVAMAAFDLVDRLEEQLTVYNDQSEVSRINQLAANQQIPVEPLLFGLLSRCVEWSRQTKGAFDITSGPLIRIWGFKDHRGRVPSEEELAGALQVVGSDKLLLDRRRKTIHFARPGVEINLGSVGKGYALDRVLGSFRQAGYQGALLSAGHSSLLALGRPSWDEAWRVDVRHPQESKRCLAKVRLRDSAMSTSGVSQQWFEQQGKRYGHLLDPRTGRPVEGTLQATAVAPSAALAEALSTAFFVAGPQWAEQYCRQNPQIGALVVSGAAPGSPMKVHQAGAIAAELATSELDKS